MSIDKTLKYKSWVEEHRPEYEVLGHYQSINKKILHRHIETGLEWSITPYNFKQGVNHPKLQATTRWTHDQYVNWLKKNRPEYEVLEPYVNGTTKIKHRHIETGYEWIVQPKTLKEGHDCVYVVREKGVKTAKISPKQYLKWVKDNRPDYIVLEDYVDGTTEIVHQHVESGIKWKVSPKKFKRRTKPDSDEILLYKGKSLYIDTTEKYTAWIKENRPDYQLVDEYINNTTPIKHKHVESDLIWKVTPRIFKRYNQPDSLSISYFKNKKILPFYTTEFYKKWIIDNRPDYVVEEDYVNTNTPIIHRHIETGFRWKVSPKSFKKGADHPHIKNTTGKWTTVRYKRWIEQNRSDYKLVEGYIDSKTPIKHEHIKTGIVWKVSPSNFKNNVSFPRSNKQGNLYRNSIIYHEWIDSVRPDYEALEDYQGAFIKILHRHKETGLTWSVSPMCFKRGVEHPSLVPNGWSRVAVEWIEMMEEIHECKIQHMQNGGEITLPNIGKVDGFCEQTNTVYEFHGDFWHGNPLIYDENDVHPINYQTYGELFEKTVSKDEEIVKQGYKLFVVWQSEFQEGSIGSFFNMI